MEEIMSAPAWQPAEVGYAGAPVPGRPHLVLLPGGAAETAPTGPVRLTRRGRVVLVGLGLALAVGLGLVGLRAAGAAEAPRVVTVEVGQTLSEVAAAELPDMSISDGILAIQLENRLTTAQVSAGQHLVIPQG
jgi:hypothetical protein